MAYGTVKMISMATRKSSVVVREEGMAGTLPFLPNEQLDRIHRQHDDRASKLSPEERPEMRAVSGHQEMATGVDRGGEDGRVLRREAVRRGPRERPDSGFGAQGDPS